MNKVVAALAVAACAVVGTVAVHASPTSATGNAFYVNCASGNDAGSGAIDQPWRTLVKAAKAPLSAGGVLYLARGCTWNGEHLDAKWAGDPNSPITVTGYGDGARPVIRNGGNYNVKVSGSYIVIDGIESANDPRQLAACGQPLGQYYGFTFLDGAHDNTLTNSVSSGSTAGVHLGTSSSATRVLNNVITANNVMQTFGTNNDLGAWGIDVLSNNNEIAFNQISSNTAVCINGTTPQESNSIELYAASGNSIHDNVSIDDRVFTELGSSATVKTTANTFANNIFATARPDARFIVTRGPSDATYGPVLSTQVLNNTTFETGPRSQAVVCDRGCSASVLRVANNILWAEEKSIYADAPFDLGANVVWNSTGTPFVQVPGSLAGISVMNPGFADPGSHNFTPTAAPGFGATVAAPGPDTSPLRILDTRPGAGQRGYWGAKPGAGDTISLQVAGRGGVPTSGVAAVTMDVIITEANADGFVTVWPSGQPRPLASSLNVEGAGSTISNLVTVPLGPDGKVQLFTQSGGHLVADVAGWLPTNAFVGSQPTRVLDTRADSRVGYNGDKPASGATVDVQLGSAQGLPASGVAAVVLNVTATEADGPGFVTVWPTGNARPWASSLNAVAGGTISNQVTVAPGAGGKVSIFVQYGMHVVVDFFGYYKAGQGFASAVPARILDTRPGPGQQDYSGAKPVAGQTVSLKVAGVGPVPASVKAVILNLTGTEAAAPGFVSAWPGGQPRPLTSVLNLTTSGQTRSNAVYVPVGADGTIQLFTQSGTHLVADVNGWLTG